MRDQFPIFQKQPDWIYLDSAATAQKPKSVIDAIAQYYTSDCATVHRAIYRHAAHTTELYNESRQTACKFLNASCSEEIVFTRGTTDAINLVAASYGRSVLQEGDEILISEMEHHSNIVPWQMIAESLGAQIRWIPIDEHGNLQWLGTINPKTKIVAVSHMSNVTGTINPIAEIAAEAHAHGAVLLVDGAQGAVHLPVDVQALDCDFYAFSGHKCYGPTGVGVLFGKKALLEQMPPVQGGGDMIARVDLDKTTYAKPPVRFEAGTPPIASVIALKSALEFIIASDRKRMAAYEDALLHLAEEKLVAIGGLRILGTAENKGPILTFHIERIHPLDLATLLDLKNISIRSGHLCAQPLLRAFGLESAARASFAIYNTLEEVDRFVDGVHHIVKTLRKRV